jgi:uncharacterized protein
MTLVVPTGERERIHALDALRGIALLGILMVNMAAFKGLSVLSNFPRPESLAQPADQYAFLAIATLFWGKFYPIFAFLFGLGFALQMKRIEARGVNPTPVLLRRLLALLGFGLIHGLFIWTGDVLFVYALCGLLLLALRNLAPRTVLYVALGLWGVQALCCFSCAGLTLWAASMGDYGASRQSDFLEPFIERAREVYAHGSYWEVQQFRFVEWLLMLANGIFFAPNAFLMFLLGLYAGKLGAFEDLGAHRRTMGWLAVIGLSLGLASQVGFGLGVLDAVRTKNEMVGYGLLSLNVVFAPILSVGYIGLFGWLWSALPALERILQPIANAGRMALTNYIMQSVICTLLFYGYGLGWGGKVGIAQGIGLTVLIWVVQVILSSLWLRWFQYGPLEWVWRMLTYGRGVALRRAVGKEAPSLLDSPPSQGV